MKATATKPVDLLDRLQGIIGRETRREFKAVGAAEKLHASLDVETLTAVKAELERHRAQAEQAYYDRSELLRHRGLVAALWNMGGNWAGQESDGSRDIDQQIRDGQKLILILAELGFGDGA